LHLREFPAGVFSIDCPDFCFRGGDILNRLKLTAFLCALLLLLCGCGTDDALDSSGSIKNDDFNAFFEVEVSNVSVEISDDISETASDNASEEVSNDVSEPLASPSAPEYEIDESLYADIPCIGIYKAETLEPIYEKNVFEDRSPASLTKLVTASVALKYSSLDKVFTVGTERKLVASDSSICGLKQGHRLSLKDLLYGLMLCSGNDAAYTIAVNVARDVSGENLDDEAAIKFFCKLMNNFCDTLGMDECNFLTPDGYEAEGQTVTASDMAVVARYVMNNSFLSIVASTPKKRVLIASGETFEWKNSNYLLHEDNKYYDSRVSGLKTGSTKKAGKCLITAVSVESGEYIVIVLGCTTEDQRYLGTTELIKYIEANN
jgi:D-alanyl-D-alanine carboxypeptidase